MSRRLSLNSEIIILTLVGFVLTVIEAMYLNLNENLHDAWKVKFPDELFPGTIENMIKSVISGIIIIRGATVHVYLASYLLLVFPVLKERRRILLLVWLMVSGFRSVLLNGVATVIGIFICSGLTEPHPACFEFLSTKGVELACSVYMWVVVNDFMYYLRRKHRIREEHIVEAIREESNVSKIEEYDPVQVPTYQENTKLKNRKNHNSDEGSEESLSSSENSVSLFEVSEGSCDSLIAKAAVNWFFRLSLGMKCHGKKADRDEELTQRFLKMPPEEIEKLTQKIKHYLAKKYAKEDKLGRVLSNDNTQNYEETKVELESCKTKCNSKSCTGDKSSVFFDQIIPSKFQSLAKAINSEQSNTSNTRNVATQTENLPKKILKFIERQEKEIKKSSY